MTEAVAHGTVGQARVARLRFAEQLARVTWVTLAVLSVAGLLGHAFGVARLTAPVHGWPAVPLLSAGALGALAAALRSVMRGARWSALAASALTLALSTTALIFFATALRLPAGGLSVASALLLGTASLALYVAALERRMDVVHLTMGIAGFMLLALSATVLFARLLGVVASGPGAMVASASLQALVGGLLLGFTFVALVWARGFTIIEPPSWLPVAVGIASLATVLFLWRALEGREEQLTRTGTRQALEAERRAIMGDVDASARSFRRAADWVANGATPDQLERDIRALLRDIPALAATVRLDGSGSPVMTVPEGSEFTAVSVAEAWRRYSRVEGWGGDSVAFLALDDVVEDFAIVAPVCDTVGCSGAVAGVIRAEHVFRRTMHDSSGGYRFGVLGPAGPIAGSPELDERDWIAEVPVRLGNMRWTMRAAPARTPGTGTRSTLPVAVLFMGLVVSALLPVTLRLGRAAWRSARAVEQQRLSRALERATDGIWEWDLTSGLASRSAGLWAHLAYDPARIAPTLDAWTSLIHPDDRERVNSALEAHVAGRTDSFEAEYRVRSSNGEWHIILDRGRVVDRAPGGAPSRMLGISADVTETRASARAREESERRFRAIFDSGFQFQLLLDCDGKVIEVNRVTLDRAGVEAAAVSGRFGWDTLWWKDDPAARAILESACRDAQRGAGRLYEQELRDRSGAVFMLEISVRPILDTEGKATQLLVEGRDVTARRRVEAALQEVDTLTAMGRVAARVAHEINNPLAGIQNSFLLIKDAVPMDHPHQKYVGAIEREIGRIARVTRQLYETYRPEAETGGEASVHMVVGDAVAFLEQVNRGARLSIETDLHGVPSTVPLSAAMLRQIVYNLVQNAADASPPGATIEVCAAVRGEELEIRVADAGPGVPVEIRERIFEPFFSTKDKRMRTGGMGLGLALVRRTVTAAQGHIRVEDGAKGGAVFTVTLPLHTDGEGDRA